MTLGAVVEIADGCLIDDPVSVRVRHLPPGRRVRLRVHCTDAAGLPFASWAEYRVSDDGTLDAARQSPLAGTYRQVDRYGLWWSMRARKTAAFTANLEPVTTTVQVELGGQIVASTSWQRVWLGPGVRADPVGAGLAATLFTPERTPAPGVIVLGGSDGGRQWAEGVAALLASRGLTALALAYFAEPGLPPTLTSVPLEYVGAAVSHLAGQETVAGDLVAIAGASRGGELALLAGAKFPQVRAVVGWAASGVVWAGLGVGGRVGGPAWTEGGEPVPYAVPSDLPSGYGRRGRPIVLRSTFEAPLQDGRTEESVIAVERVQGPLLLMSGGDDRLWPAAPLAEVAVSRLADRRHRFDVRHLHYQPAGHLAGRPPGLPAPPPASAHPADGRRYDLGGTPAADASSGADAWPQVVELLSQALPHVDGR